MPAPSAPNDAEDLFQNAPCGYLVITPAGVIVRCNATLAGWLGVDAQDCVGKRLRDLLTTPGRIFYETSVAPVLHLQAGVEELALDLVGAGGEVLPVLVNALACRDPEGRIATVRLALLRARDRRGYERDLRNSRTAAVQALSDEKSASQLREQFIAVLGHDLRNPLASIVGAARLLRRELQSEKGLKVIEMMEASVDRMAGLIDDVMDFARGRLGSGIALNRAPTSLAPVLRHVVQELETSNPSRIILCELDLPEPVSVDEGRIAQLASNLLANALTHGDPLQPVGLNASIAEDALHLSVWNSGPPIPPKAMERLFQPFFRGEVRRNHQGLGLGLHIASEIARAHGGSLGVRSDEHETRFTLIAPLV